MVRLTKEEYDRLVRPAKPPKKKRGQHGPNRKVLPKDTPPLDDGIGTLNVCPHCFDRYDPTKHGRVPPCNARQFTKRDELAGVDYDYFVCRCGMTWTRYK